MWKSELMISKFRGLEKNTCCTWSVMLPFVAKQTILYDDNDDKVSFSKLNFQGDAKNLDLGGRMQALLLKPKENPPSNDKEKQELMSLKEELTKGSTKILTGGTQRKENTKILSQTKEFSNSKFYYISPEKEGELTLASCKDAFFHQMKDAPYDIVYLFARGSTDLHMAAVNDSGIIMSDTIEYKGADSKNPIDDAVKYSSEFISKVMEKQNVMPDERNAVIFAGKSMFVDFGSATAAETGLFQKVVEASTKVEQFYEAHITNTIVVEKYGSFVRAVVEKIKSTSKNPVDVYVGSRKATVTTRGDKTKLLLKYPHSS